MTYSFLLLIFFFSHDIVNPVVPFALRLSSNLMIGVVRIYRKQTQTVWGKDMQLLLLWEHNVINQSIILLRVFHSNVLEYFRAYFRLH